MPGTRWTDDELALLADDAISVSEAADLTGRTRGAIKSMRHRVLTKGWTPKGLPAVTAAQREFIASHRSLTAEQCSDELGITYKQVVYVRRLLIRDLDLDFGTGPYDKDPHTIGGRRVVAKSCLRCGVLLGARYFNKSTKCKGGPGLHGTCSSCRALLDGDRFTSSAELEAQVRREIERQGGVPGYAENKWQPYLDADLDIMEDKSLTVPQQAARMGRTAGATQQARRAFGIADTIEDRSRFDGRWEISR